MTRDSLRPILAESTGTFALVFAGTGAIAIDEITGGGVTHVGVALTFGLVVMALIQAFGDVSGAHLNPAVTLGFVAARRFAPRAAVVYIAAQCAGALLASLLVRALFPASASLGATRPAGSDLQALGLEVVLAWLLMLVILSVASGSKERGLLAGITIGGVVAMEALFAGPISGASMNPARSLGPAVVGGDLGGLWIYLAAPVAGALLAAVTCRLVCAPECCSATRAESRP